MDTQSVQPPAKKMRKRSKSVHTKETSPVPEPEPAVAPNLNGDENAVTTEVDPKPHELDETPPIDDRSKSDGEFSENVHGRKRKASEMKDDSVTEDENSDARKEDGETGPGEAERKSDDKGDASVSDNTSLSESADDSKELKLPPKQTLGKGKRARIPNKRYSDILLSSSPHIKYHADADNSKPRTKLSSLENGEAQIHPESQEKENAVAESGSFTELTVKQESEESSPALSSPAVAAIKSRISLGSPGTKKQKISVDLSNPNYLKPFQYGWKRELVYRAASDSGAKRNGDIYYYTPGGKKVRSMREVSENLKDKKLTLDDFTFFKEPLGIEDPEKEIIREAKFKTAGTVVKKATPKVKTPKPGSPKALSPTLKASTPVAADSPKVKNVQRTNSFKMKLPVARQSKQGKLNKKAKEDEDMDVGIYPPNWQSPKKPNKWGNNSSESGGGGGKPCRPCSIRCQGVTGLIPSLQCRLCLCLYHNECVGLAPHANVQGYVCKNCQLDQDSSPSTGSSTAATIAPPPPLTPINALKSVTAQSTVLPKLQRIPPQDGQQQQQNQIAPRLINPRPPSSVSNQSEGVKSLVGSVTTWFPPSSTIQVGCNNSQSRASTLMHLGPVQAPRPQFVEYLGDKKFLIIPKHSVLSVSPNVAATAVRAVEDGASMSENNSRSVSDVVVEEASAPDSAKLGRLEVKVEVDSSAVKGVRGEEVGGAIIPGDLSAGEREDGGSLVDGGKNETPDAARTKRAPKTAGVPSGKPEGSSYMDNYLQNLAYGYNTLLYVFQYLKVQDLLRAGCVCHMWRDIASHPLLWRTVRMKNSQVHSFEGLANTLEKHNTVHLDLRKMLLPSGGDEIWPSFSQAIKKVDSLRKIELCRCPATVVEQLPLSNPKLEVINAVTIKCEQMSLAPFRSLKNLQELRLKSTSGLTLTSDLFALQELTQLKHLSLMSVKDLNKQNLDVIADLKNLESLDLGECTDFPKTFGVDILTRLTKLEKLRLEKGQGNCYTFEILEAVKNMPKLEQLELVNFDIKTGFDKALGACTNIKKLLIIPTYISQSATTNHMVLGGVLRLRSTLSHFVWGVTLELLRVTELFVDQCEEPKEKEKKDKKAPTNGDSIPVLKPVPLLTESKTEILPAHDPPQVEILPLPNLQKLLLQSLPTTRVKILKIPFHATWRQSITDTVN